MRLRAPLALAPPTNIFRAYTEEDPELLACSLPLPDEPAAPPDREKGFTLAVFASASSAALPLHDVVITPNTTSLSSSLARPDSPLPPTSTTPQSSSSEWIASMDRSLIVAGAWWWGQTRGGIPSEFFQRKFKFENLNLASPGTPFQTPARRVGARIVRTYVCRVWYVTSGYESSKFVSFCRSVQGQQPKE